MNNSFTEEAQPVLDYVEDIWIGRPDRRQVRRCVRFAYEFWNCFEAARAGPKTNNFCEGWHHSFNSLIGACHLTIWKFIDVLKKEQAINEIKIEQYIAGGEGPTQKKKYRDNALRIQRIVNDFDNREILDYLKGIAYNLAF